eukprot:10905991-Lingulodinium_polyedra.AAC.1
MRSGGARAPPPLTGLLVPDPSWAPLGRLPLQAAVHCVRLAVGQGRAAARAGEEEEEQAGGRA